MEYIFNVLGTGQLIHCCPWRKGKITKSILMFVGDTIECHGCGFKGRAMHQDTIFYIYPRRVLK